MKVFVGRRNRATHAARSAACILILFAFLALEAFAQPAGGPPPAGPEAGRQEGEINEEEYAKDSTTEINVKNADIAAIVRIFSKKTKRNYILDERVKGKVSIYLPGKVSAEESVRILDSVLAYKGFSAVPISENLWKIVPAKEARSATIPTLVDGAADHPSSRMVTRLVQLKYTGADDIKQLISQLISPDGMINSYPSTNSLIIIDSEDNIARLVDLISLMDVPSSDREMTIVPITHADAVDIAGKLSEILGIGSSGGKDGQAEGLDLIRARMSRMNPALAGQPANPPGGVPPQQQPQGGAGSPGGTPQAVGREPRIIPDERTNSIIIVADEDTTARVRALISQLDSKVDLSGFRFYVYRCQHASADELADVLSGLTGGVSTAGRGRTGGDNAGFGSGVGTDLISGGLGSSRTGSSTFGSSLNRGGTGMSSSQNRLRSSSRSPGQSLLNRPSTGGAKGANLGENISITSDPATNSLIIFASKTDYNKIKALLQKLDIKRRQVLVEAMLLEVGLDEQQQTSMSWITSTGGADGGVLMQNNGNNIANLLANPSGIQNFSIAAASSGSLNIGKDTIIPSQTILLQAAQSNTNVNVLSAPTLLTTDNQQAEIVVGQNVPFLASTATSQENLSNTFNSIDRQDVGITLRITPQISSGESVTLKIFTEVSNVVSTDPSLGPTTGVRTSETAVITKDGQMIVIGGLMADDINQSESGVPYLKEIPVLGHLFRTTGTRQRRTNLLILITPRIIRDQFDAREQTIAGRSRFEHELDVENLYPRREEILRSEDVDRVAESETFEGTLPSTIRGPERPGNRAAGEDRDLVLDFNVDEQPGSPSSPQAAKEPAARANDAKPSMKESFFDASGKESYVVLKAADGADTGVLPFPVNDSGLAAVAIPADVSKDKRSFFQVGQPYVYQTDRGAPRFTPLGVFQSVEEAHGFYPEVGNWYTLSPYEIMGLGEGPWRRGPG